MSKKIMFVCHGNICRSPMAEYMFRSMVEEAGRADEFEISSKNSASLSIHLLAGNSLSMASIAKAMRLIR